MGLEKQHNLTKKEKAVMKYVYQEATKSDGVCLLRPVDIAQNLSFNLDYEENEIKAVLKALQIDDFLDVTETDKKGEYFYCINLHAKGLAFARAEKAFKSSLKFKLFLTIATPLLTVTITCILRLVLSKLGIWK